MTTTMPSLSFGTALTSPTDALQTSSLTEVFTLITTDAMLQQTTARLRKLAQLDKEAAKTIKTRLPYVVGSAFTDSEGVACRRGTDFQAAYYFVLDIDHCRGLNGQLPNAVREHESVALGFVSPSGEGVKLFIPLAEPCTDARQFSVAYRDFASDFATQHRWAEGIDLRTSDVTRACFLAHDPAAHLNLRARAIDWRVWLVADEDTDVTLAPSPTIRKPLTERPIDPVAYGAVLKQLNPNAPVRREKQCFVPDELRQAEPVVRELCVQLNWELRAVESLNYGLKFVVRQGLRSAEVSVYWGKRGYSLVRSPKTGTDPALNDLLYGQLFSLFFPEPVSEGALLSVSPN
jgi:hypothetical protein